MRSPAILWRFIVPIAVTALMFAALTTSPADAKSYPKRGDHSARVLKLERALHKNHVLKKKNVNRTFGKATTKALRKYQKRQHLEVTGKVNSQTWKRLFSTKPPSRPAPPKPLPKPPPVPKPPTAKHLVLVEGHSGAALFAPENTMPSFRLAAAARADYLGTDVRWTSDGVMYLFHDADLAPKTDCSGPVQTKTWDEIKGCRIGGEPIATFDEYLAFAREQGLGISPELKQPDLTVEQAAAYAAAVRQHGLTDYAVASSFDAAALARLRSVAPDIETGLLTYRAPASVATAKAAGTTYLPWKDSMTPAKVAEYHRAGLKVWTWTARSQADFQQCYDLLADSVITDDPAGLRLWLEDDN